MEVSYKIIPNCMREDWPNPKAFKTEKLHQIAYEEFQSKVPFYGCPYDINLSWREMVLELRTKIHSITSEDSVQYETLPYVSQAPTVDSILSVIPIITYQDWKPSFNDRAHMQQYAYINWEIISWK